VIYHLNGGARLRRRRPDHDAAAVCINHFSKNEDVEAMSKFFAASLVCLALSSLALTGCQEEAVGIPHTHHAEAEVTLCGLCGHIKDSEDCCQEGAEICPICGLNKGSILCCSSAINGRRDVVLCRKCGEKVFTKKCCAEGFEICPKCGLHKGSPGCCKIEPVPPDFEGESIEHAHAGGHD
jgi:hypothetical protein